MQLKLLFQTLDDIRRENGTEYWYARDLFPLLGYARWENFESAISRAKDACKMAGGDLDAHFRDITKMVTGGVAEVPVSDIKLTRYASYLVALNGDPRKEEVAFAQAYFVTKTNQMEVLEQKMREFERIDAREKLKITEKEFADMAFSRGVDGSGIAYIRSVGDKALFGGKTTEQMKKKLGVEKGPLTDVLPSITLRAKDLATAMTTENTRRKNLRGTNPIGTEHQENNASIREALVKKKIYPEELPAAENIKKLESRHRSEKSALEKQQRKELKEATKKANDQGRISG